ncbi:hypothetical protein [Vibrio parahaemolyticus]|uniref:hypothetical protein n=1 Tax=Vibrio parahaemolyticus TaxID=670 RepID=UPI001FAC314B|nr:hypothetical protein [Vibrio parahaemolyticus]MCI9718739.1 hypothetical protein [Vibrio parahaemolyticus]
MSEFYIASAKLIIPAVLGFFSGMFVTIWRTKYSIKSSDFSKQVEQLSSLVDSIAENACEVIRVKSMSDTLESNSDYLSALLSKLSFSIGELDSNYRDFKSEMVKKAYLNFANMCRGHYSEGSITVDNELKMRRVLIASESLKSELHKVRLKKY